MFVQYYAADEEDNMPINFGGELIFHDKTAHTICWFSSSYLFIIHNELSRHLH